MAYDIFILALAGLGLTAVVVSSYKMSQTRVYAIGIVRDERPARSSDQPRVQSVNDRSAEQHKTEKHLGLAKHKSYKEWYCSKCGYGQELAKHPLKNHCLNPSCADYSANEITLGHESERMIEIQMRVEESVEGHDKVLQAHTRLLHDFEARLRRVEINTLQSAQKSEDSHSEVDAETVN